MELRRVLAKDGRSAAEKAIAEYGRDVLVISTSRVGSQVELILAIEEVARPTDVAAQSPVQSRDHEASAPPTSGSFRDELSSLQMAPSRMGSESLPESGRAAADEVACISSSREDIPDSIAAHVIVQKIREEFAQLRRELMSGARAGAAALGAVRPECQLLADGLDDAGVPSELRARLLEKVVGTSTPEEAARAWSGHLLEALKSMAVGPPTRGVHAICGASGVGKTLCTVRIAREASKELPSDQIAVVSYADNRPGAWVQLQVLASALGVSTYRARNFEALSAVLQELAQYDLVLIDTPGAEFLRRGEELLSLPTRPCLHAVMPADANQAALSRVLTLGGGLLTSIIVSKLDEAASPWPLLRALCNQALPISGMSASDQPSMGLMPFDARSLVEVAMGQVFRYIQIAESGRNDANGQSMVKSREQFGLSASNG